jgi:hypothetical protein
VQRGEERRQARTPVAETARRAWQRVRRSAEAKCERVGDEGIRVASMWRGVRKEWRSASHIRVRTKDTHRTRVG